MTEQFYHLILANIRIGDWNEPGVVDTTRTGFILSATISLAEHEKQLTDLRQKYYRRLPYLVTVNEEQCEIISKILGIECESYRDLEYKWPAKIDDSALDQIIAAVPLNFFQSKKVTSGPNQNYALVVNHHFWQQAFKSKLVGPFIQNISDQNLMPFEVFHDTREQAEAHRVILLGRLAHEMGPSGSFEFYENVLGQGLSYDYNWPGNSFNTRKTYKAEDRRDEYNRILAEEAAEIANVGKAMRALENPPLDIVKL